MQENVGANLLPFLNSEKDRRENHIREDVFEAAGRIWSRVLHDAASQGQDSVPAANVLEATCRSVSRLMRGRRKDDPIQDLDSYLYWSFVRGYSRHMARESRIKYVGSLEALVDGMGKPDHSWVSRLDDNILVKEFLSYLQPRIRTMVIRRLEGDSWDEIGAMFDMSGHNAEVQAANAIERARIRLFGRGSHGRGRGSR